MVVNPMVQSEKKKQKKHQLNKSKSQKKNYQ